MGIDLDIVRNFELSILGMVNEFKTYENEHGFLFKILFYSAVTCTILVFLQMIGLRIYNSIISTFFNISFRLKGAIFNVYQLFVLVIIFVAAILVVLKLQSEQFTKNLQLDTPEKKLYRLKYKWIVEEQLWLITLILFEIIAIYRLSQLFDWEVELESEDEELEYIADTRKDFINQENLMNSEETLQNIQTQASYNEIN